MDDLPSEVSSGAPSNAAPGAVPALDFRRVSQSNTCFKTDYVCLLANYTRADAADADGGAEGGS